MVRRPGHGKRDNVSYGVRRHCHQLCLQVGKLSRVSRYVDLLVESVIITPRPAVIVGVNKDKLEKGVEMPK